MDRTPGLGNAAGPEAWLSPPPRASVALVLVPRPTSTNAADDDDDARARDFQAARRVELNIAPVNLPGGGGRSGGGNGGALAKGDQAAEEEVAGQFEPTCFTADELEALSGR